MLGVWGAQAFDASIFRADSCVQAKNLVCVVLHRYFHWGVRLDASELHVTHITTGPLLKWNDYAGRGFLKGVVSIGSYHVLPGPSGWRPGGREVLRMFFGEGDKFSCWKDISLDSIQWFMLPAGAVEPADDPFV